MTHKKLNHVLRRGVTKYKKAYQWDFYGSDKPFPLMPKATKFSVGIFQWLPTYKENILIRGKVEYRVRGNGGNVEAVFRRAREICRLLDKKLTVIADIKSETVK